MEEDAATVPGLTAPLVGREYELTLFSSLVQKIKTEGRSLFLISGPPGIGKSRLLDEFYTNAAAMREGSAEPDGPAASGRPGRAGETEAGPMPEPPAVGRFRFRERIALPGEAVWRRILRRFNAVLPADKGWIENPPGIVDTFLRICRTAPVILFLDNLHLAGEQFLIQLDDLLEELREMPLLVVAAYQDLPAYRERFLTFLSDIKHISQVVEHRLFNLSAEETLRLAETIIGEPPAKPIIQKIMIQTKGNPLFVQEVSRLIAQNRDRYEEDPSRLWEKEIPQAIHTAVGRRLVKLSPPCLELLRLLSLLGEGFSEDEIAEVWPEDNFSEGLQCMQEAIDYGFFNVGGNGKRYYFSHTIIRSAIMSSIPETELEEKCRLLVEKMETGGFSSREEWALKLADLWSMIRGDEAVKKYRHYIKTSAEAAFEDGEFELTAKLLEKILPLGIESARSKEEAELYYKLGEAKSLSGYRSEASELYNKAFKYYQEQHDVDGMVGIASRHEYIRVGEPGYIDFYKDSLESLPVQSEEKAWILLNYALVLTTNVGDLKKAEEILRDVENIIEGTEHHRLKLLAVIARSGIDFMCMRHEEALRKLQHAEKIRKEDDPFVEVHITGTKLFILPVLGKLSEAGREIPKYIDITLKLKDRYYISFSFYHIGHLKTLEGRWREAKEFLDTGMSYYPYLSELLACRASIEYMLGNTGRGDLYRRRLLNLQQRTPFGPYKPHIYASYTSAVRALCTGEQGDAAKWVAALQKIAKDKTAHPFITIRAHLCLLLSGIVLNDKTLVREHAAVLEKPQQYYLIRPVKTAWAAGLGALHLGRIEEAVTHLEKALQSARWYQDAPMEGCILYDLGRTYFRHGRDRSATKKAKQTLNEAHEIAARLEMSPLLERVRASLEEVTGSGIGPYCTLTEREKQILDLVAQGMSNNYIADRLNISVHTVANHIRHILEKTGTTNRSAAAAAFRRMQESN
jgi:DNA-binding CsgD family transcriptional regulator